MQVIDFKKNRKHKIIKATAGLGKTDKVVAVLLNSNSVLSNNKTHYLVPTHALANELHNMIKKIHPSLDTIVMKGRTQPGMCEKASIMVNGVPLPELLGKLGISVYSHLCNNETDDDTIILKCPHYEDCPYLKQFDEAKNCDVVIQTHDAIRLRDRIEYYHGKAPKLSKPDYLVIDESFWNKLVAVYNVAIGKLIVEANGSNISTDEKNIIHTTINAINSGKNILPELRANGITTITLKDAVKEASMRIDRTCGITPITPDTNCQNIANKITREPPIYRLLLCLLHDSKMNRTIEQQAVFNKHTGKIELRYTYDTLPLYDDVYTLVIDANVDPDIISRLLKKPFDFHDIHVKRKSFVKQVSTKAFSTNSMKKIGNKSKHDKEVDRLMCETHEFIQNRANIHESGLVVCPHEIESIWFHNEDNNPNNITLPPGWHVTHFGAYRGIDKFKNMECVVVIGRNQPRVCDVESMTCAIFMDDPSPVTLIGNMFHKEVRGYTTTGNTNDSTEVDYHPDARCDRILKQIRECETVQAVSRIRDVWKTNKHVYLLSNVVVDLEINRLIPWKELKHGGSRFECMMDEFNFSLPLPLTASFCTKRFPHLWKTVNQFKYDKHKLKGLKLLYNILLGKSNLLKIMRFKGLKTRRWSDVITQYDTELTAVLLEDQLGYEVTLKPDFEYSMTQQLIAV